MCRHIHFYSNVLFDTRCPQDKTEKDGAGGEQGAFGGDPLSTEVRSRTGPAIEALMEMYRRTMELQPVQLKEEQRRKVVQHQFQFPRSKQQEETPKALYVRMKDLNGKWVQPRDKKE